MSVEETLPPTSEQPLKFHYKNWRGEYALRTVLPRRIWFGSTEWHPEPQWFMEARDLDKNQLRDFALLDIDFQRDQ